MRTSATARRWERGILALVLATAVALTAVAHTDAEAIDGPVEVVYIATGNNFADALVASVVAAMNGAPLLTVKSPGVSGDEIPQFTKDKLAELEPAKIVVLGGAMAVSDKVFNELKAYSPDVTRVDGEDRFETATLIADLVPEAVKRAFFADKAGDADTLDGMDSAAFARSDKSCPSGQVAKGTNASGNPICTPDNNNGGDADTLDGLDSSDFAPADLGILHTYVNLVTAIGTDDVVVATLSPELSDPCGGGVTRHTYLVEATGVAFTNSGSDEAFARQSIGINSTTVTFNESWQATNLDVASVNGAGNFAARRLVANLAPGPHTFNLVADRGTGNATYDIHDTVLTAKYLGFDCSGAAAFQSDTDPQVTGSTNAS